MTPKPKGTDQADKQKGRFGGSPRRNGRTLSADVRKWGEDEDWFRIKLLVTPDPGKPPVEGEVSFYLHQTFKPEVQTVKARRGEAKLVVYAYGAFTVGAVLDDGKTELELDMSTLSNAPEEFREN